MKLTYRFRVKDNGAHHLERHARAVNFVWNYLCRIQRHAQLWRKPWPTRFDLIKLTGGACIELGLHSRTVEEICSRFVAARRAHQKCPRFRGKKSLGWIPFSTATEAVKISDDTIIYKKRKYRFWLSRPIEGKMLCGSFGCDSRGRWYFSITCENDDELQTGYGEVGIDLGFKDLAVLSDGTRIDNPRHSAKWEKKLAIAHRANNKTRIQTINAKIANSRTHHLHQQSLRIARSYATIVVGNLKPSSLAKTKMAKSVLDAGWATFRNQLRYKASRHGAEYIEVSEAWTTRSCSACGARSGPEGRKGLGVRTWVCESCGCAHDRDVNAAQNILMLGLERQPLIAGMSQ